MHLESIDANILLQSDDDWPLLTDFGIATLRTTDQSRAQATQRFGTPELMSPEQALGDWDADHRSDIYSLGLVAYAHYPTRSAPRIGGRALLASLRSVPYDGARPKTVRVMGE